jgi:hypothetical protein
MYIALFSIVFVGVFIILVGLIFEIEIFLKVTIILLGVVIIFSSFSGLRRMKNFEFG